MSARKRTPEGEIKRAIFDRLKYVPRCSVLPQVVAGLWDEQRGIRKKSQMRLGTPDILACIRGYFVAIEVKSPKGKLSPHQELLLEELRLAGAFCLVARSVDDLEQFLKSNGFVS